MATTMRHQIGFEKAWPKVIPLVEEANRDLVFQQWPSLGGGKTMGSRLALCPQKSSGGRGTHGQQLASVFLRQPKVAAAL